METSTTLQTALLGLSICLASSGCAPAGTYEDEHATKDLTMETYTPTPVEMTDVSLPQDAIDQLVVATVRTALEPMADGIAFLNERSAATASAVLLGAGRFYLPAATYANDDFYALTIQDSTAYADGYPLIEANSISGGGNSIVVNVGGADGRDVGWWRVSADISEIDLGGDVATQVEVYQFNRAASADPLSGSIVAVWDTTKRTGAGNSGSLKGEYVFSQPAGTARIGLALRVSAVGGHVISGTSPTLRARVSIHQLNRVP